MVIFYLISLLGLLANALFFPKAHLFTFAPFLAVVLIRSPLIKGLWISALAGLTFDLLSSQLPFGLYLVNFVFTALVLYRLRHLFFEEKPLSLSLFSALVGSLFTLGECVLLALFASLPPFTTKTLTATLFLMPLFDALFSFFCFSMPFKLYTLVKRVRW